MEVPKIVSDDDPLRCQGVTNRGQCTNQRIEGSTFCPSHGGNRAVQEAERQSLRNYRLTKFNARLQQLGNSPDIKNLRDEIDILRMVLEERLNQCKDSKELIYQSGPISDMVMKIDKVVTSCHKLEGSMGSLLDKSAIIQVGNEVVAIMSEEITDEDTLSRVGAKIAEAIVKTVAGDEDSL